MDRGTVPFYRNATGIPSRYRSRLAAAAFLSFLARRATHPTIPIALALVSVATLWLSLSRVVAIDYWDSHNFLLQARRLVEPESVIPLDPRRPRLLVGLLAAVGLVTPSLAAARVAMVLVTVTSILLWWRLASRLFGAPAAQLAAWFLLAQPMVTHYAFAILSDHLSSAMLAAQGLAWTAWRDAPDSRGKAAVAGIAGAGLALSKSHFLFFFPLLVLIALASRRGGRGALLVGAATHAIVLDLGLRFLGAGSEGMLALLGSVLLQAKDAAGKPTSLLIYAETVRSSVTLGLLAWAATGLARRERSPALPASAARRELGGALALHVAALALMPHREARYLVPFLPFPLAWLAHWGLSARLSPRWRAAWCLAGAMAALPLFSGVARSVFDFRSARLATLGRESEALWHYLGEGRCGSIVACRFHVVARSTRDPYWLRYDIGPHYRSMTGLPTRLVRCGHPTASLESGLEFLAKQAADGPGPCLVWRAWRSPEAEPFLVAFRPSDYAVAGSRTCRGDRVACYEAREFFRGGKR